MKKQTVLRILALAVVWLMITISVPNLSILGLSFGTGTVKAQTYTTCSDCLNGNGWWCVADERCVLNDNYNGGDRCTEDTNVLHGSAYVNQCSAGTSQTPPQQTSPQLVSVSFSPDPPKSGQQFYITTMLTGVDKNNM
ncbi:MAG: hypothetical protein NT120_02400, partial [Candidatus Aenigmarchaeota archaeon]|nr:hypothetical protein [Candidatus Aenigmarchaeota archaeon]